MADLNVQPKQKKSILPWLLLALGILALLFFLFRGCNNKDNALPAGADSVSSAMNTNTGAAANGNAGGTDTTVAAATGVGGWGNVDFNAPAAKFEEITDTTISVRGNEKFAIYGLGENILFDEGKNALRSNAQKNLQQIASSISKRFSGAQVRVFGYTDSIGSPGYNKQLAEQRAEAVRNWLVKNGNISEGSISLQPVGEARPVATNATEQGRQQNRRVEIVALAQHGAK